MSQLLLNDQKKAAFNIEYRICSCYNSANDSTAKIHPNNSANDSTAKRHVKNYVPIRRVQKLCATFTYLP